MAPSLFIVIPLVFLSIFPFFANCGLRGYRNISCLVCHRNTDIENRGGRSCLGREDVNPQDIHRPSTLLQRRMIVMDRCALCSIQDNWDLTTKEYDGDRIRKCIVTKTNTAGVGCSYHYPAGEDNRVIEICRCDTNLCNLKGISSIGGKDDINQFPKKEAYVQESNSSNRKFIWKFIIMLNIILKNLII